MKLLFVVVSLEKGVSQKDLDIIRDKALAQGYKLSILLQGNIEPEDENWNTLLEFTRGEYLTVHSGTTPEVIWEIIRSKSAKKTNRYYACSRGGVPHCVITAVEHQLR